MGGDSQPAKIAKYLLKGYCLLNEYCPNGQNVPLVRSREGVLLCCCDDPTCPYKEKSAAPAAAASPRPPAVQAAAAVEPPQPASPQHAAASKASEANLTGAGAPPAQAPALAAASYGFQPQIRTVGSSAAAAAQGEVELTLQGPNFQFSCTRLAVQQGRRARLLGGSFSVKVRIATNGQVLDLSSLRDVVGEGCQKLHERVLVPEQGRGVQVSRAAGQVMVACEDGGRFEFPERDCLALSTASTSAEEIAASLMEVAMSSDVMSELRSSGRVGWIEVSVAEGMAMEATIRRSCS